MCKTSRVSAQDQPSWGFHVLPPPSCSCLGSKPTELALLRTTVRSRTTHVGCRLGSGPTELALLPVRLRDLHARVVDVSAQDQPSYAAGVLGYPFILEELWQAFTSRLRTNRAGVATGTHGIGFILRRSVPPRERPPSQARAPESARCARVLGVKRRSVRDPRLPVSRLHPATYELSHARDLRRCLTGCITFS
jgi:hypothetical protein